MMKHMRSLTMLILLVCALVLAGCAASGPAAKAPASGLSCAEAGAVDAQVTAEAEVTGLACYFKDYQGANSLHFDVKVKNVSKADQRYRVNLFLDNGKAVGGLLPDKGKPPVLKPGEEKSFTYPFKGMDVKAGSVTLLVKAVSQ